jgi:hypothetical protein
VLVRQCVEEGDHVEVVDLDRTSVSRIKHGGDPVTAVQEFIFELVEGSWPRAGKERD